MSPECIQADVLSLVFCVFSLFVWSSELEFLVGEILYLRIGKHGFHGVLDVLGVDEGPLDAWEIRWVIVRDGSYEMIQQALSLTDLLPDIRDNVIGKRLMVSWQSQFILSLIFHLLNDIFCQILGHLVQLPHSFRCSRIPLELLQSLFLCFCFGLLLDWLSDCVHLSAVGLEDVI